MRVWIAIWTGSTIISRRLADVIGGGSGGASVFKLVLLFGGALFAKGLPWTKNLCWALALAWLGTAIYLGLRQADSEEKAKAATQPAAPGTKARADLTRDETIERLHRLLGEKGGVHLARLAEDLGCGIPQVRALLARHTIRVRPVVRAPGRGPTVGVHRTDIPPLPQPLSEGAAADGVGVVPAGHPGTTTTTTPPSEPREGERPVLVPDPDNPHETHVIYLPPKR